MYHNNCANALSRSENRAKPTLVAEAYEIDQLHTYSKQYLIEIVKYLHQTLELNCQNTNKRMEEELTNEN